MTITGWCDIYNLAMIRLSNSRSWSSDATFTADTTTKEARVIKSYWATTLDEVLGDHEWNEAMKRGAIATPTANTTIPGFTHRGSLPSDCIRVIGAENDQEYEIEGSYIYFVDTLTIRYISKIAYTELRTALLAECLALRLASKLATPLTGQMNLEMKIIQEYNAKVSEAKKKDSKESPKQTVSDTSWFDDMEQAYITPGSLPGRSQQ